MVRYYLVRNIVGELLGGDCTDEGGVTHEWLG